MSGCRRQLAVLLALFPSLLMAGEDWDQLKEDYAAAYSGGELLRLGAFFGASAILANTDADQEIRDRWQEDFRGDPADDIMDFFQEVGNVAHAGLPIFWLVRGHAERKRMPQLATWSDRAFRASLIAIPQHVILREVIGNARPNEGPSDWDPFEFNAGVSGHAVYGAIPFMVAAREAESFGGQALWWTLSTMSGLSRVHNDRHYLSQFIAGWGVAWSATRVVKRADEGRDGGNLSILPLADGAMLVGSWPLD